MPSMPVLAKQCSVVLSLHISPAEAQAGTQQIVRFYEANGQARWVPLQIPAGVRCGETIRIANAGGPNPLSGLLDDLIVCVSIVDQQRAELRGDDLCITLPVTRAMLASGHTLTLRLRRGITLSFSLPAGSSADARFRWQGWGEARQRGSGYGDLIVELDCPEPTPQPARLSVKPSRLSRLRALFFQTSRT